MMPHVDTTVAAPAVAPLRCPAIASASLPDLPQEDPQVFWNVWEYYRDDLLTRFCLRWMDGNREEAEDALSSASLRACRYWPTYARDLMNVRAWLIRLLYNHCMNLRKASRRQRQFVQPDEAVSAKTSKESPPVEESLEAAMLQHEMHAYLYQAIATLPGRLQEPLWLYLQEELAPRDIARQLNLSPENVRKRLQQARAMLRTRLAYYVQHEPDCQASLAALNSCAED